MEHVWFEFEEDLVNNKMGLKVSYSRYLEANDTI